MKYLIRYSWVALVLIQISCVFYFFGNTTNEHGIHNRDAFSYYIQWSRMADTFNPLIDPVLKDPGHDLVRIPFSFPHFALGLTSTVITPFYAYLFWCCIGVLLSYVSLVLLARSFGFKDSVAYVVALLHYSLFHLISQLPPLSSKQFSYVQEALILSPQALLHFGPRQYPHDIFFYPLLCTLMALTLFGIKKMKAQESISLRHLLLWGGLSVLLPFNYLYHWFQFAALLGILLLVGTALRWWKITDFLGQYARVSWIVISVGIFWVIIILIQNHQLTDEEGYRFALMGGLTEARFFLLPTGLLARIILWSIVVLVLIRITPDTVLLVGFLIGCVVLLNLQLIVGKTIQPGHWSFGVDRIFAWMAILVGAVVVNRYFQSFKSKILKITWVVVLFYFLGQSFVSWKSFERISRWDEERAELIDFLKVQPAGVVLAPEIWLETDILTHTRHYSFLPRGAQSAVSHREQVERLTHAALMLGYSEQGFLKWLRIRSVRFFGILYGTDKEFSSSFYYDKARQKEVVKFTEKGLLPSWDWAEINHYMTSKDFLTKQIDWIVLFADEPMPVVKGDIVFQNDRYRIVQAGPIEMKSWGSNDPIKEQRYPIVKLSQIE